MFYVNSFGNETKGVIAIHTTNETIISYFFKNLVSALLAGSHACKWGFCTKNLLLSVSKCRVLQSFVLWTEALDVQNWSGWNLLTVKNITWWREISGVVCYAAHYKVQFVCLFVLLFLLLSVFLRHSLGCNIMSKHFWNTWWGSSIYLLSCRTASTASLKFG